MTLPPTASLRTTPSLPPGSRVLVAGATGHLGHHVVQALARRGYRVRALARRPPAAPIPGVAEVITGDLLRPSTLPPACAGVDAVFSCAGASLDPRRLSDRCSFTAVDYLGNRALLDAALAVGVGRFGYVSLFGGAELARTEYARAHERFAGDVAASGVAATVVRPTGFFHTFDEIFRTARGGRGLVIGSGDARTNPIHEADLAEACADALALGRAAVSIGGPETLTRAEIVRLALAAAGRPSRLTHVSPRLFTALATVTRPLHPRLAGLLEFGAAVSVIDAVAPPFGTRRLGDYFAELAGTTAGRDPSVEAVGARD
jgi:uncharacterized protein YbjT (DUF2867 family)